VPTVEKKSLKTVAISELLDVEVPFTFSSDIVDWTVFRLAASLSIFQVFLGSLEWLARLDSKYCALLCLTAVLYRFLCLL
jgi:hypothetical protein